jgi:hypothetical protein
MDASSGASINDKATAERAGDDLAASISLTSSEPAARASDAQRRPGRPKGLGRVVGSGRAKGTKNRFSQDLREMILSRGRPIELLCDISSGRKIRIGPQAGPGDPQYTFPTLAQRIEAAALLMRKVAPDLSASTIEATTAATVRHESDLGDGRLPDELEVARQIAFILDRARRRIEERRGASEPTLEPVVIEAPRTSESAPTPPTKPQPPPLQILQEGPGGRFTVTRRSDGRVMSFFTFREDAERFCAEHGGAGPAAASATGTG